jgi:hypothetical protein
VIPAKTSSLVLLNIQELLNQRVLLVDLNPQKKALVVQDSLEGYDVAGTTSQSDEITSDTEVRGFLQQRV